MALPGTSASQVEIFHNLSALLPPAAGNQLLLTAAHPGEGLLHPLSETLEKYQGGEEAGTLLQRDAGFLSILLGLWSPTF